jgi:hypothetical protein
VAKSYSFVELRRMANRSFQDSLVLCPYVAVGNTLDIMCKVFASGERIGRIAIASGLWPWSTDVSVRGIVAYWFLCACDQSRAKRYRLKESVWILWGFW